MKEYDVLQYGAIADGVANDTFAIQRAIDECALSGGGRVLLGKKKCYRCGMIILKDGVELYIDKDSMLKASDNLADFTYDTQEEVTPVTTPTWENCDYEGKPTKFFIYAKGARSVSIAGFGRIDGNEHIFYGKVTKWHIDGYFYPRIPMIYLEDCKNVKIEDIILQESGFWTTHLVGCEDVDINRIKIYNNLRLANCDGIDPDHCKNVKIKDCYIESADDCIVFKATKNAKEYGNCENITVSNCTLMSTSAAIKFGTESVSDFKNITIEDCKIIQSNRGISLQLRDEGNISDVHFRNISIETRRFSPTHWWGKAEPISITAVKRNNATSLGSISNITFENITMDSENGIFIYSDSVNHIRDIKMNSVHLSLKNKTNWEKNTHDIRPCMGSGIIEADLTDMYIRYASNITITNYKVKVASNIKEYFSKNRILESVENVEIV